MAWGIGANDVANAMGTSVGSKALTIKQAICIAAIFEFCGAFLAGGTVTDTISKGITNADYFTDAPELLVYGMMGSLLAAGTWLAIATRFGYPVSTTHSIIGAIIGFTAAGVGIGAVQWIEVSEIVMSWVVSPLMGGLLSFILFTSVQWLILRSPNPYKQAQRYVPFYMFFAGMVISLITTTKGLTHLGLDLGFWAASGIALLIGFIVMGVGTFFLRRIQPAPTQDRNQMFANVEKIFAILMIFTACAMAFAHGSNDVANAVGPMAAIMAAIQHGGEFGAKVGVSTWVLFIGSVGIVIGLITYGHKVIATVGEGITHLTPSRGFAAELGAATTVVTASAMGLPISTTHTLVGAVLGVGLARGIGAINLRVVRSIFASWVVTLPAGAILSIIFFYIFKWIFT
ncbi:MAG: inorganic phosphate transporter [Gammaproteobacteria bacterium]